MRTRLLLLLVVPGASCLAVSVLLGLWAPLPLPLPHPLTELPTPALPVGAQRFSTFPQPAFFLARQPKSNSPKILPHQISCVLITIILHL